MVHMLAPTVTEPEPHSHAEQHISRTLAGLMCGLFASPTSSNNHTCRPLCACNPTGARGTPTAPAGTALLGGGPGAEGAPPGWTFFPG